MIGEYLDDWTDRRAAKWAEFTERQKLGEIVRHASRDLALERARLFAEREQRAAAMAPVDRPRLRVVSR